jgi:hypothetical protein
MAGRAQGMLAESPLVAALVVAVLAEASLLADVVSVGAGVHGAVESAWTADLKPPAASLTAAGRVSFSAKLSLTPASNNTTNVEQRT